MMQGAPQRAPETFQIQGKFSASLPQGVYAHWVQPIQKVSANKGALFLDRDGVINEDVGYLSCVEDLKINPFIVPFIVEAREQEREVVIVTNQSGVGRGFLNWDKFHKIQEALYKGLKVLHPNGCISLTLACPFHEDALAPYNVKNHPWRKPNPGMLNFAAQVLHIDLLQSLMIGDQETDREAAESCGVCFRSTPL